MAGGRLRNILFHGIGRPGRALEPGEDRVWISTDQFHVILDEIATWPNAAISFDDGNLSDIEIGLPALQERGLSAKFFVLAGRLGTSGSLTENDVKELHHSGMSIGTHGMHHRPWREVRDSSRDAEFIDARDRLAEITGSPVNEASAPLGSYDRRVLSDLRALGYTALHTSDRRPAKVGAWLQPRFSVRNHDTPESLRADVTSAETMFRRVTLAAKGVVKRLR